MSDTPFRIVFALYDGIAQLDFTGPHQFMTRVPDSEIVVASLNGGSVRADGLTFADTLRLEDVSGCDLLCVPGGGAAMDVASDPAFLAQIRRLGSGAAWITSVCTGSLILGAAGLLIGKRAACHWASRHLLTHFGAIPDDGRVVRDGNVVTGGGITAGIDFALTVIGAIRGDAVARLIQLGLEYAPQPPFDSGRPETAPPELVAQFEQSMAATLARREVQARACAAALNLASAK